MSAAWTTEVYARGALAPGLAWFVIALATVLFVAGAIAALGRMRRRDALAAAAEASVTGAPPSLVEGTDVVLAGTVRLLAGKHVAVRVSVHQQGAESERSGLWTYTWTEVGREVVVEPFVLELANGQHVVVNPPRNVDVSDALDQVQWHDRQRRTLFAELRPGERIFARGRLDRSDRATPGGAYRDTQWGWALGPSGGQMLLSSEPLGQGMRRRAGFHRGAGAIACLLLFAMQLSLGLFYGRLFGETVTETVVDKDTTSSRDKKGNTTFRYWVTVREQEVELSNAAHMVVRVGDSIPIRVGSETNWQLGSSATIGWIHAVILAGGSIAFWVYYTGRRARSRPWFRRRLDEKGDGRLSGPPPVHGGSAHP
ncbi:MAG: hypothetical protein JNL83_08130 [Myxococcales bacterium]|nr:hypothetical protein [Myxococcales bacterium]